MRSARAEGWLPEQGEAPDLGDPLIPCEIALKKWRGVLMIAQKNALRAGVLLCMAAAPSAGTPLPLEQASRIFGARPNLYSAALSPNGSKIVMIGAAGARTRLVYVLDVASGKSRPITYSGDDTTLTGCGWASEDRIVCAFRGTAYAYGQRVGFTRLAAMDPDGKNMRDLSRQSVGNTLRISQFSGEIIDWLDGATPNVLMMRDHVPEQTTGSRAASSDDGYGVERVDTRSLHSTSIERAVPNASVFLTDGQGNVRIMGVDPVDNQGLLKGWTDYRYRPTGQHGWQTFSRVAIDGDKTALRPVAVDAKEEIAYAVMPLDGRDALYRVKLDGSLKSELAYANKTVDVSDVVTIGRHGRVIGVDYVTDRRATEYFDPEYKKLSIALSKALPNLPLITFESATADETKLLIRASSDMDGGHFFLFDKKDRHLSEIAPVRPQLDGITTANVRSISYPAGDGTTVPAYLTLPPGSSGKGLPAIVLPHGGPAARDEWGFDWLAQFLAARGFAVLQPQFRGSTGFGDAWFVDNGFKSWKTAVHDVNAAGEWLVKEGIADPAKLAILGWSYGGYAALQSNVLDPKLFRAVVAIAPVTDLRMLRTEAVGFTNAAIVQDYIGSGPHLTEGSPRLHADRFQAPVLLFHGDRDMNVAVGESVAMETALRQAGKDCQLVRYPALDHQLDDSDVRADMLTKIDSFLRKALAM